MSPLSIPGFEHLESRRLCLALCKELIEERNLNEFLENAFGWIGQAFGVGRICLVDYYEQTGYFDLLHFSGYPSDAVHQLGRRLEEMEVRRALSERLPYASTLNPHFWCIPLYFSQVLEAVLVLEGDRPIQAGPAQQEAAHILSRLLGVLMSSTRLAVNQKHQFDPADLRRARQIQVSFLPRQTPRCEICEVYGFNRASATVGGDYFDYFQPGDDSLQCILADACGHGLAAALIMSNFRGLLQTRISAREAPHQLFDSLNQDVHFDEDFIQYLTGIFLDYRATGRALSYLNAGHYEPLVFSRDGSCRTLPGGGPPLGMFKNSRYPLGQARLAPGDLVVLFTDGLVDVEGSRGAYFGVEGVGDAIRGSLEAPLPEIAETVLGRAQSFSDDRLDDDVTLLLMRV